MESVGGQVVIYEQKTGINDAIMTNDLHILKIPAPDKDVIVKIKPSDSQCHQEIS